MHSCGLPAAERVDVLPSAQCYRAGAYKISYVYARKILKCRLVDRFIALPYVLPNPLAPVKFSRISTRCFRARLLF